MTAIDTIRLDQLESRIRSVWSRGQLLHLLTGALAFVVCLVPLFFIGMLIDWMTYMPAVGRAVILLVLLGVSLWRGWACGWRRLRAFDAVRTALQIESHYTDLKSLLVSAIQMRSQDNITGSTALRDHICQLAEAAASNLRPQDAVPFKPLKRPAMFAAMFVALVVVFATINGPFFAAGLTRIFTPWVTAEYPTNTQITLGQETLIIKEGDPAELTAQLAGVIPDQATIYVRTGEGRARAIDLDVIDDACTYQIASAARDFTYRIKAGDDRTAWHNVRVVPAPRIEQVKVNLQYPEYLQRETESIEALTLTVPEGTDLDWQLTLDRPIASAAFVRDGEEPVELQVGSDGRTLAFTADVLASQGYRFTWVDQEHGYRFDSPRYFMQVAADQAPRVELTSPATNLVAMLGRPVQLAVRAHDDHGIGSTAIIYRANQHDEKLIVLPKNVASGQGEQALDWDYREVLTELAIGDTVSFVVQVADRYPSEQGAHIVRSETRRITFLSKEQYLEQINKQRDRLLSRVQTIYRQQRSAHALVHELDPSDDSYLQSCQLEAIRQEMVRDQLNEIASQLTVLLDDLAANSLANSDQADAIEALRAELKKIAEEHIAQAATLLREQSGTVEADRSDSIGLANAANAVNTAARGLGSLVLLRGIEAAQEVYARETRMLAQLQATLRWQTIVNRSPDKAKLIAQHQDDLAQWTASLLDDLQAGMRYDKRSLAVLRLVRSIKDLRSSGAIKRMGQASSLIGQMQTEQAAELQAELVRTLLDAEFSVRLSGAYATLLETRDLVESMLLVQTQLRTKSEDLPAATFAKQLREMATVQTTLRKQLLTMMLPTVPAPRAALFDESPSKAPPIDQLLASADQAMTLALAKLDSEDQLKVLVHQQEAERVLGDLLSAVDRWSLEMGLQSQGLSTLVSATSDRMSRIEDYEARTIGLLDKTDIAASDDQSVIRLAESQLNLTIELADYIKALQKRNQTEPDPDLPPVLSRLMVAERALNAGVQSLKDNKADEAISQQEVSADALAEAYAITLSQNERLGLLQELLMFQRAVGFANGYMTDIVAQQRDLLAQTEAAKPEDMKVLLPQFTHMKDCMEDVAPMLDLVAARLDVGTPLVFAKTDFEDAIASLQSGDQFDAIDAQDVAAESLSKVQELVKAIQVETGYIAEIVDYLHQSVSNASMLAYRQNELRTKLLAIEQNDLQRYIEAQQGLLTDATRHSKQLFSTTGSPALVPPADPLFPSTIPAEPVPVLADPVSEMQQALVALKAGDAAAAAEQMELAELVYADNAEAMLMVITMLRGLPEVILTSDTDPALLRLVETLAVASEHKQLFRATQVTADDKLDNIAKSQSDLALRLSAIAKAGESHPLLKQADDHMTNVLAAFKVANRDPLRDSQRFVDETLRHFIVEQALILETAKIPPAPSSDPPPNADGDGSDEEADVTAGFIADFVSGETPTDQRSEWKVLGERNRAALNQNFARELPLEYRGLLKNYYERVAK